MKEQLLEGISHIGPKYKAKKFIAYFLNFTNTYMPLDVFEKSMEEACQVEGIVALDISTRPDCINDAYLEVLDRMRQRYHVDITVELGLQSANAHTLVILNRCHTVAEFMQRFVSADMDLGFAHILLRTCHGMIDWMWWKPPNWCQFFRLQK